MIETTPASRHKSRIQLAAISTLSILLILATDYEHRPVFIWNATASVPVGLYRLSPVAPAPGDIVAVRLPQSIADFASARGYLPHNVLLLKPLGAAAKDNFCRRGSLVFVNGALRAIASVADRHGQRLPMWRGCVTLRPDEIVVIGTGRDSFDSRYFGSIATRTMVGRAVPIWTNPQ